MLRKGEKPRGGWAGAVCTWTLRTRDKGQKTAGPGRGFVGRVVGRLEGLLQAGEACLWTEEEPL